MKRHNSVLLLINVIHHLLQKSSMVFSGLGENKSNYLLNVFSVEEQIKLEEVRADCGLKFFYSIYTYAWHLSTYYSESLCSLMPILLLASGSEGIMTN